MKKLFTFVVALFAAFTLNAETITVAQALEIGAELEVGASTAEQYTIRGHVSSIAIPFSEKNGNQSFYIADDSLSVANSNKNGGFYIFRGKPETGNAIGLGALVEITTVIYKYKSGSAGVIENLETNITVKVIYDAPECLTYPGTCGDNLKWELGCDSVLVISGTGEMPNYSYSSPAPWNEYERIIKSVVIEEGVSYVGTNAFAYYDKIEDVRIPSSVTGIGKSAFVSTATAFYVDEANPNYSSIDGVLFNKDQTILIEYPEKKSNAQYTIPNTVKCISASAFYSNDELTSIIIPNSVTTIEHSAFRYCRAITSVSIPNSVVSIGYEAFEYCDELATVNISSSVTSIDDATFAGCEKLQSINVDEANPNYCSIDGVLFNKDQTTLVQYPIGKEETQYTIPNTVTSIGGYAFSYILFREDDIKLTSIIIPNTVTKIEGAAFFSCPSLTITNYATTPQKIDKNVFQGTEISTCTLYVPSTSLEAYQNADVWKDFGSIKAIEDTPTPCVEASGTCGENLSWELSCEGVLTISGSGAMTNYEMDYYVPWHKYLTKMHSIILDDGLTSIGQCAFHGCSYLTLVDIPNTVTSIGDYAFWSCDDLTLIEIPSSVTSIGTDVFSYCNALTSIVVETGNPVFDSRNNCNAIIETASNKLIWGCKNTIIPNSVTSIGNAAFEGCTGLTTIDIPGSVTYIGNQAFNWCISLTSITCEAVTPPSLGMQVFLDVDTSIPLYVPAESVDAYKDAFQWKDFDNILPIEEPIKTEEADLNVIYKGEDDKQLYTEIVTLHVPVAPEIEGFTFIGWDVVSGHLNDGIIIQAVYEANEPSSAPVVYTNPSNPAQKLIRNGNVYILTDDSRTYTLTGQEVK